MSEKRDKGPRDDEQEEGESGATTPAVPIGGPRERMKLASPAAKVALLVYYLAVIAGVVVVGADHLSALEVAPERDLASEQAAARGEEADGGSVERGPAAGRGAQPPVSAERSGDARPPGGAPLRDVLALVVLAGILGGALHGLSSMEAFAGRGVFYESWLLFYVARPFLGAGMALTVAVVLGARFLGAYVDFAVHPWVPVGWAVMAGLFSTPALKKLRDLFEVLFQRQQAPSGPTELGARAPLIEAAAPVTVKKPSPPPADGQKPNQGG